MFRRILIPLDGSTLSEAIIPWVQQMATDTDTAVVLLIVGAPPRAVEQHGPEIAYLDQLMADRERELHWSLEPWARRLQEAGIPASIRVRLGAPAEEILACAAAEGVDAIAMCTHGRSGLDRVLHGSVAGTVLRTAGLPVLLYRPTEPAFVQHEEAIREPQSVRLV